MNISKVSSQLGTMSNEQMAKHLSNAEFVSKLADIKFNYGKEGMDEFLIRESALQALKTPKSILEKAKEMFFELNHVKSAK